MSIKIPYLRKGISSTLIALSAIALLLSSPLVLSNILLQPVQAQTNLSFRTPTPASGTSHTTGAEVSLMFDAQGTSSSIDPQTAAITSGTMEITEDGQRAYGGNIQGGTYNNNTSGGILSAYGPIDQIGDTFYIDATCGTSVNSPISVDIQISGGGGTIHFNGPVECIPSQAGRDTTHSSMTGTTTTQDSDGDGIPDSSDRCAHNSNPRCFKEDT
ncbi:MAG: hypothetical protein ACJ70Z_08665 [Nitrososphaera sp.]